MRRTDDVFVTADGCRIAYSIHHASNGKLPRITLVHSLALDRSFWDRVVALIGDRAEILTFDCRGHGQSSRAPGVYSLPLFARDLAELLNHVQWPSTHLAGASMGGCVSQAFATEYPSSVSSLCLIDTTAWYGPDAPKHWRERAAKAREGGLSALMDFQATRWFSDRFRQENPEVLTELQAIFLKNDINCYQATCEMLGDADLRDKVPRLNVPAAIIVGAEDYATPVSMAEWLNQAIARSTLKVIEGCRHFSPVERPDVIAAELMKLAA